MNTKPKYVLSIVFIPALLFSSCNQNEFKSSDKGYKYKIVMEGRGPGFENNHYILMSMDYYYENDSLLYTSSQRGVPVSMQYIDTLWEKRGQLYQGLKSLHVGDSAIFRVKCSDLYEVSFRGNVPYGLNPNAEITVHIGITDMIDQTGFRMWQAGLIQSRQERIRERRAQQFLEDIYLIDLYLEEQGIVAMELESGIRYIIKNPGNGIKPEEGDHITLHYTGYLLDGTRFDSSLDKQEPFEYVMGTGDVIKGWDECIAVLSEGAASTFYVPSTLAYGENGQGNLIAPNSILVFDLEMLEIMKKENLK